MGKAKKSSGLGLDGVEQSHGDLVQYIKERLSFLVEDYGFCLHPIPPFNKKARGGTSSVTFAKKCGVTELWIRIEMEYSALWGVILWDIEQATCKAMGVHKLIPKRCPRQTFKPSTRDNQESNREYINYLGTMLKAHFEDLLQGDLTILSKKQGRS